jgi:hypothetical protein
MYELYLRSPTMTSMSTYFTVESLNYLMLSHKLLWVALCPNSKGLHKLLKGQKVLMCPNFEDSLRYSEMCQREWGVVLCTNYTHLNRL